MIDPVLTPTPLLAATGFMLVDFIKPLLLLPGVIIYARIASTYIEKDVRYHNLGVNKINLIMILGAIVAYAAGVLIPISFSMFASRPSALVWPSSMCSVSSEREYFQPTTLV